MSESSGSFPYKSDDESGGERPPIKVPRPPDIGEDYEVWLKYLRQLEKLEPHDHPTLQSARRQTRSIVRRKIGFGPALESHSLKAFSFESCRKRRSGRRDENNGAPDTVG